MMILVASQNPVKVNAVAEAFKVCFSEAFDIEGLPVNSGVSHQPRSDGETRTGAKNGSIQLSGGANHFHA